MHPYLSRILGAAVLLAMVAAMLFVHGPFGIVLLLPPVGLGWFFYNCVRRGRWRTAAIAASVYLGLWALTQAVGAPQVRQQMLPVNLPDATWLNYDPYMSRTRAPEPPWCFVGQGLAPCPLVVSVDYGFMAAPLMGMGGRYYYLWFFGYRVLIWEQLFWVS